ncbi:MAG: hypothetical protein AMXMBFR44_1310 [Candidatus Campbellbacteria bacterium]
MNRKQTRTLVLLGVVLLLTQVIGIPLLWKQWISAGIGLFYIAWGLYLRYGGTLRQEVSHDETTHIA